jgi:hypothetical protein
MALPFLGYIDEWSKQILRRCVRLAHLTDSGVRWAGG